MASKIGKLGIVVALTVILLVGIAAITYSEVGVTCEIGSGGLPLTANDLSAVPQSVVEDATRLATELFGDSQEQCDGFVSQLLALYSEAQDKDFIILFNPGGWGWNSVENSPGWWSIFSGIKLELDGAGYSSLFLDYQRTAQTLQGRLNESMQMITAYSSKANDLACRVEFITHQIPDLKVIITGESNGTIISDKVMNILRDNPQVYSIQTGPPFWHENAMLDRTLLMTSNGITPDSFSQGDFLAVFWGYLKIPLGLSQPIDDFDTLPHYVAAPGHDYWWQFPEVQFQITNFFDKNFGVKW